MSNVSRPKNRIPGPRKPLRPAWFYPVGTFLFDRYGRAWMVIRWISRRWSREWRHDRPLPVPATETNKEKPNG